MALRELLDSAGSGTYVVQVFAISPGGMDVELVEAGAAPEHELLSEVWVIGDLADEVR